MGINSMMGSAVQGIQQSTHGIRRVASEIAGHQQAPQTKPTDLSRAMVEMQQHATQGKASVKVLQSIDDALGSLFDDHA